MTRTENQQRRTADWDGQVATLPGRAAQPCPDCRGPFFWFSIYDATLATPRCCDCHAAPSASLARAPLWGIVGPPGGPWWWESLGGPGGEDGTGGTDERLSTEHLAVTGGVEPSDERDNRKLIEHTYHGHRLITVVGSGTVAGCGDNWTKCLVWCWPDKVEDKKGERDER